MLKAAVVLRICCRHSSIFNKINCVKKSQFLNGNVLKWLVTAHNYSLTSAKYSINLTAATPDDFPRFKERIQNSKLSSSSSDDYSSSISSSSSSLVSTNSSSSSSSVSTNSSSSSSSVSTNSSSSTTSSSSLPASIAEELKRLKEDKSEQKFMRVVLCYKFGDPKVLKVQNMIRPEPHKGEVLIRVEAAGINPVDSYIRQGLYKNLPDLPAVLGKEVSGVIEEINNAYSASYSLKVGDRVYARLDEDGYAEWVTTDIDNVVPLPDCLSFSQGASLYVTYYTAYRALLLRGDLYQTDDIMIHGASGGVGTAAVQIAKNVGCRKIAGTAGTEEGLRLIRDLGCNYTFNHRKKGHMYEAKTALGEKGFDFILENLADLYLSEDVDTLGYGGRIAVVGCRGDVRITPRGLMATEGQIFGVNLGRMTQDEKQQCAAFLNDGIEEGWINPVVGREYSLSECVQAHEDIIYKTASLGHLVFRMNHSDPLIPFTKDLSEDVESYIDPNKVYD